MDKIRINNLKFHTKNGVHPEEKKFGQQIELDIELRLSLEAAGKTDDLQKTVNYGEINQLIAQQVNNHSYNLMEALVSHLLDDIENAYASQLNSIAITVRKYSVPMPGIFDNIEITMEREIK